MPNRAAAQALDLVQQQFKAGAVSYIDLLSAQTAYQQTKIALIKAKATRLSDTAALFQSLGGGWWHATRNKIKTKTVGQDHGNCFLSESLRAPIYRGNPVPISPRGLALVGGLDRHGG